MKKVRLALKYVIYLSSLILLPSSIFAQDFYPKLENGEISEKLMAAFCGIPKPEENSCFCGNRIGYAQSDNNEVSCDNGTLVQNINVMGNHDIIRFLAVFLYGKTIENSGISGYCTALDPNADSSNPKCSTTTRLESIRLTPAFSGSFPQMSAHFVATLIGKEACLSGLENGNWRGYFKGMPNTGEAFEGNSKETWFAVGCNLNYRGVWRALQR